MSKSIEIKKLCDSIRNFSECELDYGTLKTLKMIEDYSDNMSAEIEAQSKVGYATQELLKDKNSEIARLKAELEKKEKVLNELRPYLEPAGIEYNDLEEMFDEKHIDRDGPDMVLVPTSHWNKIQTAFYVGRTQMLDFKSELEKRPDVVECENCSEWKNIKFTQYGVKYGECNGIDMPGTKIQLKTFCNMGCSFGQRKSEEGK